MHFHLAYVRACHIARSTFPYRLCRMSFASCCSTSTSASRASTTSTSFSRHSSTRSQCTTQQRTLHIIHRNSTIHTLLANVQVSISMIAERPHVHDFTKAIQQHALQTVCSLATLRAQSAGLSVRVSTRSATETAHLRLLYTGHLLSVCGCAV